METSDRVWCWISAVIIILLVWLVVFQNKVIDKEREVIMEQGWVVHECKTILPTCYDIMKNTSLSIPKAKYNAPACAWWCNGESSSFVHGNREQMLEMCAGNCVLVNST